MALQFADRLHGCAQRFDDLVHRQISEIPCGQRAQHPETDIRRTGAHCQLVLMEDLVVVGRKPRGLIGNKVREIPPGSVARPFSATSDPSAGSRKRFGFARGRRFKSHPIRGERNHKPSQGPASARFAGIQRYTAQPRIPLKRLARPMESTNAGSRRRGAPMRHPGRCPLEQTPGARRAGDTRPAEWRPAPARPGAEAARPRRPSAAGRGPPSRGRSSSTPDGWSPR